MIKHLLQWQQLSQLSTLDDQNQKIFAGEKEEFGKDDSDDDDDNDDGGGGGGDDDDGFESNVVPLHIMEELKLMQPLYINIITTVGVLIQECLD